MTGLVEILLGLWIIAMITVLVSIYIQDSR